MGSNAVIRSLHPVVRLLAVMLLLGISACNGSSDNPTGFVTDVLVEDANGNPATSFSSGQQIQFVFKTHNGSKTPVTLVQQACGPYSQLLVVKSDTTDVVFEQIDPQVHCNHTGLMQVTIPAGEAGQQKYVWDQMDGSQLVAPGQYAVDAGFFCSQSALCVTPVPTAPRTEFNSGAVTFTINP